MGRPSVQGERRAQIVAGLRLAMAQEGYARASVARIAKAAGLSPGLVHHHFPSKGAILLALVEDLKAGLNARWAKGEQGLGPKPEPWARVEAMVEAFLALGEGARPDQVGAWCMVGAEAQRDPEVAQAYGACLGEWRERARGLLEACPGVTKAGAAFAAGAWVAWVEGAYRVGTAAPGLAPAGFAARAGQVALRAWALQEA